MYGYVIPDKANLLMKEFGLYRAHYCGVCRAVKELYGQLPRIATNYDITFFSLFVHDVAGVEVDFEQRRCALRGFQRTGNIALNPLLERVAAINILSAYYKALDNRLDEGRKRPMAARLLKGAYKKAKRALPELDKRFEYHYKRLRGLEGQGCKSVDAAADCFAEMMRDAGKEALREKYIDAAGEFLYHLGKWVYLADALDDLDEDFKKKRYNPFLCAYTNQGTGNKEQGTGYADRESFVETNKDGICAAFYGSMNRMGEIFTELSLTQSQNLLRNIAVYGIRNKTAQLLDAKSKLKRERV